MVNNIDLFYSDGEIDNRKFINTLHGEPTKYFSPPELKWDLAPSFYPLRFGASTLRFNDSSHNNSGSFSPQVSKFEILGCWLWKSYSAHRTAIVSDVSNHKKIMVRRVLPSGGACYPNDIYISFDTKWGPGLSDYIWVYMPQHHALACHSLNQSKKKCSTESDEITISLVTVLSRTAFKYREFAYRLTAVDTGVLLGRMIGTSDEFCRSVSLEMNHLPGEFELLSPEEILSAKITVCLKPSSTAATSPKCSPIGNVKFRTETSAKERRDAISSGQPSIFSQLELDAEINNDRVGWKSRYYGKHTMAKLSKVREFTCDSTTVNVDYSVKKIIERRSNINRFTGRACNQRIIESCFLNATACIDKMLTLNGGKLHHSLSLRAAILQVEGYREGIVCFNEQENKIIVLKEASVRHELSQAMLIKTSDISMSSFIVHIVTNLDWNTDNPSLRGYRNSQILVGAAIEAISMTAVNAGLSSHAFLGFSEPVLANLYGLNSDDNLKITAQVCVGYANSLNVMEAPIVR